MDRIGIRNQLKKNNFIYSAYSSIADHNYRAGYAGYLLRKYAKSWEQVRKELALIRKYWNCNPDYYFRYRLYEKDLKPEELLDYVPPYYFYNFYMPHIYRDTDFPLDDRKISLNEYFISRGIDTPKMLAAVRKGVLLDSSLNQMNFKKLMEQLRDSVQSKFFMKPDNGRGGKGISVIVKKKGNLFIDEERMTSKLFSSLTKENDFIVQEAITQRKDFSVFYPGSVNTLRVITQRRGNKPTISAVVLRLGRKGAFVDNSTNGGISVEVDVTTGMLGKYAYTEHTTERFDSHPETGFRFEGYVIKDWSEITRKVLEFSAKTPELRDVGWDIAVLDRGVMAIEVNLNYGLDHLQCCIGGMRRRLSIEPLIYFDKR